jgi:predicted adenylyl cyclase CyaB
MANFEIELRGLLNKEQLNKLNSFLKKNGKLIKEYKRTQWMFGLSRAKKIDLRIKETNQNYEFSLKVGRLGSSSRREISIPFPKEKADEALDFLKFLGKKEGLTAKRNALIYEYEGIEWALVEVPKHSYYFEAEKLVSSKEESLTAKREISKIVSDLGLKLFKSKEYLEYLKSLDEEANERFSL